MPAHARFLRPAILAAVDILEGCLDVVDFEQLYADWGLTYRGRVHALPRNLAAALSTLVLGYPDTLTADGGDLTEAVINRAIKAMLSSRLGEGLKGERTRLVESLKESGYVIENGRLMRALAVPLNFTAIDDDVHSAVEQLGFLTTKGHLEQAAKAHRGGDWASANSQLRSAFVSLLDEASRKLDPVGAAKATTEENRRQLLSQLNPPFLDPNLNEWSADGKNFINGVIKRLHPQGAHPGLSDEEDSTFRLHLVLLVSRLLLRRLRK